MLAGDRAPHRDAEADNFVSRRDCPLELLVIPRVKKNDGVQVAIAGVKNIADLESVSAANFADMTQRLREFGARNHTVLHIIGRRKPSNRTKRILSPLPQQFAFFIVSREAYF